MLFGGSFGSFDCPTRVLREEGAAMLRVVVCGLFNRRVPPQHINRDLVGCGPAFYVTA